MDLTFVSSRKMRLYLMFLLGKTHSMSEESSPYEVSQSGMSAVSVPELPPEVPTSVPKVFGIIHICYASLGGIVTFMGVAGVYFIQFLAQKGGDEFKEIRPMANAYDGMTSYVLIDAGLSILLAVMLLVSGIGLLKRRAWAIKLSNFWSVSRIVAAVGMMIWGLAVMSDFQDQVTAGQNAQQQQLQQMGQNVGNVFGIIVVCIYPIVSLIFLSKKRVRDAMH
jgi:uncharacterized membrane protein YhaH (DUF805 family)